MESLEAYHLYLIRKKCRPSTIKVSIRTVRLVQKNVRNFCYEDINSFFLHLLDTGHGLAYINRLVCAIRTYAQSADLDEKLQHFKFFRGKSSFIKATMSDEEIEAFLALSPSRKKQHNRKMTMFWKACAFTGMRTGEVAGLTIDAIDFGRGVFILELTKTYTPRVVPIPPNIEKELKEYISNLKGECLFPSAYGGNGGIISGSIWGDDFQKRINKLGIKRKNLTPYSLRHSFITRMLEEDVNIHKVAKIAGHRIEQTATYEHLTTKDIQEAVRRLPLVRRATNPMEILQALKKVIEGFRLAQDTRFSYEVLETENSLELKVEITRKPA